MKSNIDKIAIKQYTQLISSTLVMTLLQFVVTSILTRAMNPNVFATYKLILNTNLLIQGLMTLGIPVTLSFLLTGDNVNSRKLIGAGVKAALVSSIIGTLVCFGLLYLQLNTGLSVVDNTALYFTPLCIIPVMLYYSEYICVGTNDIKLLAWQKMLVQVLLVFLLLLCWLLFGQIDLVTSMIVYAVSSILVIIYLFVKLGTDLKTEAGMVSDLFKANRTLGLQTYIGSLFSIVSVRALNVIVDTYITKEEYALFSLAITISAPLGPFISTIGSVMFKKFNKLNQMGKKFIAMIVSITAISCVVYIIGIQIFTPIVFGDFYRGSIVYAQALGIGSLLVGLGDVFNRFIVAKGKGKYIRNSAIITGIVNIGIAIVLISGLKSIGVTISTVASNLTYLLLMIVSYILVVKGLQSKAANH